MPVIGLKFRSFSGKREPDVPRGEIKINSTPTIKDVKEISIPELGKKVMSVYFEISTTYDPNIGRIEVTGDVLYSANDISKTVSEWKKKKVLPPQITTEILNYLLRKCLIKISNIAEDLQLPPPLSFPRVRPQKQPETDYVG